MPIRNGYQWTGKGRWISLNLRRPKKPGGKQKLAPITKTSASDDEDTPMPAKQAIDDEDPAASVPLPRYNAMLAVLRNTLYMYIYSLNHAFCAHIS